MELLLRDESILRGTSGWCSDTSTEWRTIGATERHGAGSCAQSNVKIREEVPTADITVMLVHAVSIVLDCRESAHWTVVAEVQLDVAHAFASTRELVGVASPTNPSPLIVRLHGNGFQPPLNGTELVTAGAVTRAQQFGAARRGPKV